MSNCGKWTANESATEPRAFGRQNSYRKAAAWLDGHGTVFDLGCGTGWARQYFEKSFYVGVDGSPSPFTSIVMDLVAFNIPAESILIRHVIEHDWRWKEILVNACLSFRKRMALITFLPLTDQPTHSLWEEDPGGGIVPNLSINEAELRQIIGPYLVHEEQLEPDPLLKCERIFYLEKNHG